MANRRSKPAYRHPPDRGPAPDEQRLLAVARRVTKATGEPVIGGVAVILHGGGRSTMDVDIAVSDLWQTHTALEADGILWDSARREHTADGVAVHMVPASVLGAAAPIKRTSTIKGIKVASLSDLVRIKLASGLTSPARAKDLAHVVDLISRVPLTKAFAAKLPTHLRAPFKRLVENVHSD